MYSFGMVLYAMWTGYHPFHPSIIEEGGQDCAKRGGGLLIGRSEASDSRFSDGTTSGGSETAALYGPYG